MYIKKLIAALGESKVSQNETVLFHHSKDESIHPPAYPDVVCFPESRKDVEDILAIASEYNVPVTPFGAGTGLEGQAIPIHKGITISFEKMNKVVEYSPEDMRIVVQPGITRTTLNQRVNRDGLFFPIDPGADATIGGMVATNASGTTAVRYGSMRDQILDLEVVLADGTVIHTGTNAKKSSSGYHLTGLFTGSEGTLGLITQVTLKLHGIPEYSMMARCTFESLEDCIGAVQTLLLSGIPFMRIELIDSVSIEMMNQQSGHSFPVKHSIFMEFAGFKRAVEEEVKLASEILLDFHASDWAVARSEKEKSEVWKARHELSYAFQHLDGLEEIGGDVCVPISRLPELVTFARERIDQSGLKGAIWGHVGDGNFHTSIIYNPNIERERNAAMETNDAIVHLAIEGGGTCTGEHGVGLGKKKFQQKEHGAALDVMKRMKQFYDPKGILNPGKILD